MLEGQRTPESPESTASRPSAMPEAATTALTTKQAFRRVFPGVMVAMFLAAADQTILASALPTIATSLGGLADVSWVVVAYLLAATIAAPLYGHLGDRFGRRRMLLGAIFAINLPLGLLAAVLASRVPHVPIRRTERFRPDIVGALLFCGATFALLFALSSGGHRFAWSSWFLWILLGGAVVGYLLLVA